jgi:hypothetical protein
MYVLHLFLTTMDAKSGLGCRESLKEAAHEPGFAKRLVDRRADD